MNLLANPSFNEGYYHQDDVPELAVPEGWQLHFVDDDTFPGCGNPPAYRPEAVVWHIKDAPEREQGLFFLDGAYCFKVFKAHAPVYFAVTQTVTGLSPGALHRFVAQVFPDIVKGYRRGKKVGPDDIWHAEARAGWSSPQTPWPCAKDGKVNWSKWHNVESENFRFGEYNQIWQEFVGPASGQAQVWLECKAKWGDAENNWFMDAFSLELLENKPQVLEHDSGRARGAPRVQFERTFILLPRNLPPQMVVAAMRVAYEVCATIGFSADDAGIGDLDKRRVICVNPDEIGSGLNQAWYDEHYPGVAFSVVQADSSGELAKKLRAAV